jgi:Uma2 family endonuclease
MVAVPRTGPWTEADLVELPENGRRYELLEGALIVHPPASGRHQRISLLLAKLIDGSLPASLAAAEAVGIRVPDGSMVVPDILVADLPALLAANSGVLDPSAVRVVVEIVSPSSSSMDRLTKPALYAGAAIPAYWRVELDEGPSLYAFRLAGQTYELAGTARPDDPLTLDEPFSVVLDIAGIL